MSLKLVTPSDEETTLPDVISKEKIPDGTVGKFVVIQKNGERQVCLFHSNKEHARAVGYFMEPHTVFIAAGTWVKKYGEVMLEYNSSTCCDKYGYDRPKDTEEAKKLLEELKALLSSE